MKAYEGKENYIFISYAHADGSIVVPIIETLQSNGFRVWYDLGIEAGTEWPAYIEDHLNKCARVIAFISHSAVESINCRNEINYALMKKKEMLVVYIEETELKHGLSLQLNAVQSLFKNRHASTKTFYEELINARMLQCCKDTSANTGFIPDEPINMPPLDELADELGLLEALESGNRNKIKSSRANKPAAVSTVGTIPSNDPNNHWPAGSYSQIIDEDQYKVIHFHCRFIRPIQKSGNRETGIMIFDKEDNLVHESRTTIDFDVGNDRFSIRWIISDDNGLKQKPGDYTAIVWVDDSRIFEYTFRVVSSRNFGFSNPGTTTNPPPTYGNNQTNMTTAQTEVQKLKDKLMYPKLWRRHLLTSILFLLAMAGVNIDEQLIAIPALIGAIWSYICFWKLTKKHLIKNGWLNALVMTVGYGYYGIFIFFAGIYSACNKTKWKIQIIQYERGIIS